MKLARSNFIVEYKTKRRHSQIKPASIWGDLDLRALARGFELSSGLLDVDQPEVPLILADAAPFEPKRHQRNDHIDINGLENDTITIAPQGDTSTTVAIEENALDGETNLLAPHTVAVRAAKSRTMRRPNVQFAQIPRAFVTLGSRRNLFGQYCHLEEELATLEAENHRLRRLMFMKLREENDRLRSMLQRFIGT